MEALIDPVPAQEQTTTATTTVLSDDERNALGFRLLAASRRGDLGLVQSLLAQGADIDFVGSDGYTALMCAMSRNHSAVAKFFMARGANLSLACEDGDTALDLAIQRKNSKLVRRLMGQYQQAPRLASLLRLAKWADMPLLALALPTSSEATFTSRIAGNSLLEHSITNSNLPLLRSLLALPGAAATIHSTAPEHAIQGRSPFSYAYQIVSLSLLPPRVALAELFRTSVQQLPDDQAAVAERQALLMWLPTSAPLVFINLLETGAVTLDQPLMLGTYQQPTTLMHLAVMTSTTLRTCSGTATTLFNEVENYASAHGLELPVDVRDAEGFTPFGRAIQAHHVPEATVLRLVQLNAMLELPTAQQSVIVAAVRRAATAALVTELLRRGVDANSVGTDGEPALPAAAALGNLEVVRALLEHGADINGHAERSRMTALHAACSSGSQAIVEHLLQHGARMSLDAASESPLSLAKRRVGGAGIAALLDAPWQGPCTVCESDEALLHPLSACGHAFCRECLAQWVASSVASRSIDLKCPHTSCRQQVAHQDVHVFAADQRTVELFERLVLQHACGSWEDFYWCPAPDCNGGGFSECYAVQCTDCEHRWCSACGEGHHAPGTTCATELTLTADLAWKRANSKRCPQCKAYVQHDGGCSHMRCPCGFEFCYVCNGKYIPGRYSFDLQSCPCAR